MRGHRSLQAKRAAGEFLTRKTVSQTSPERLKPSFDMQCMNDEIDLSLTFGWHYVPVQRPPTGPALPPDVFTPIEEEFDAGRGRSRSVLDNQTHLNLTRIDSGMIRGARGRSPLLPYFREKGATMKA